MDNRHGRSSNKSLLIPPPLLLLLLILLLLLVAGLPLSGAAEDAPPSSASSSMGRRQRQQPPSPQLDEIRTRIIRSLGLTREPDLTKVNVTAKEREEAYRLYHRQRSLMEQEQQGNLVSSRSPPRQLQKRDVVQEEQPQHGDDHRQHHVQKEKEEEEVEEDEEEEEEEEEEEMEHDEDDSEEETGESSLETLLVTQQVFSFQAVGVTSSASTFWDDLEAREHQEAAGEPGNSVERSDDNETTVASSLLFPATLSFCFRVPRPGNVSSLTLRLLKELQNGGAAPLHAHARPALATLRVLRESAESSDRWPPVPPTMVAAQRVIVRGGEWEAIDLSPLVEDLDVHHRHNPNHHHHHDHQHHGHCLRLRVECDECGPLALAVDEELVSRKDGNGDRDAFSSTTTEEKEEEMVSSTLASVPRLPENQLSSSRSPSLDVRVSLALPAPSSLSTVRRKRWTKHPRRRKSSSPSTSAPSSRASRLDFENESFQGRSNCSGNKGKCCRHRMYVNFTQLKMEFVVEPAGFDAFFCKGKCPYRYNPAHTHALIQSSMHALKKAPKPCCAPSNLTNLVIMHYDENNKLKVTNWTNAIVNECACA